MSRKKGVKRLSARLAKRLKQSAASRRITAKARSQDRKRQTKDKRVPLAQSIAHDEIWVTQDRRPIPVWAMSEEHVRNALRMVIRMQRQRKLAALEDREQRYVRDLIWPESIPRPRWMEINAAVSEPDNEHGEQ